jgi:hypothetical protein
VDDITDYVEGPGRRLGPVTVAAIAVAVGAGVLAAVIRIAAAVGGVEAGAPTPTPTPTPTSSAAEAGAPARTAVPASTPNVFASVLVAQLQSRPGVASEVIGRRHPRGVMLCGVDVLGGDQERRRVFVWLQCADLATGPEAAARAGSAVPAVLVTNGQQGTGVVVKDVVFPRQAFLDEDIDAMFPAGVADRIKARDVDPQPTLDELVAEAEKLWGPHPPW